MPLIHGYLPLPSIKLSKYFPAETNIAEKRKYHPWVKIWEGHSRNTCIFFNWKTTPKITKNFFLHSLRYKPLLRNQHVCLSTYCTEWLNSSIPLWLKFSPSVVQICVTSTISSSLVWKYCHLSSFLSRERDDNHSVRCPVSA